jgi:hypothetical protein
MFNNAARVRPSARTILILVGVTLAVAAVPGSASAAVRTGSAQDPQGDASALGGPLLDLRSVAVRYDDAAGTIRVTWTYWNDVRVGYDPSARPEGWTQLSDAPPIGQVFDQAMVQWWGDKADDGSWTIGTALSLTKANGSLSGTGTISDDGRALTAEFTRSQLAGHDWQRIQMTNSGGDESGEFWFDGYSDPDPEPALGSIIPAPPGPPVPDVEDLSRLGMSINDGARYTNDPDVTLSVIAPSWVSSLRVANDGGFRAANTFRVRNSIGWRLDESGRERLPKTVYLRFGHDAQTFTDDIILDQTDPLLTSATAARPASTASSKRTFRVRIRANDKTSGLAKLQFAARSKRHPSAPRKYARSSRYTGTRAPRYVRVRDRAGNYSRWRSIR